MGFSANATWRTAPRSKSGSAGLIADTPLRPLLMAPKSVIRQRRIVTSVTIHMIAVATATITATSS